MKMLVGLGIFIQSFYFEKNLSLIVMAKIVFLNKQTNVCWFKYDLTGFYNFTLRNIAISQYHIYRKQMKKCFFPKMKHFCTANTIADQEKVRSFSDSAPSD